MSTDSWLPYRVFYSIIIKALYLDGNYISYFRDSEEKKNPYFSCQRLELELGLMSQILDFLALSFQIITNDNIS